MFNSTETNDFIMPTTILLLPNPHLIWGKAGKGVLYFIVLKPTLNFTTPSSQTPFQVC
jgi:hypothetical protein